MARAVTTGLARDSASAEDSAFRRHWTWRTRLWVTAVGWMIAVVLWILYRTLRIRLVDDGGWFARRPDGGPVLAVFWHESIALVPAIVSRCGWPGRVTVMLSWHRDAEIAAQAMRRFGIRSVRGSENRGRLGGLRGLVEARRRGEDIAIAPDGPRGPRRRAKEGVVQLARVTKLPVLVIGTAAQPVRRLGSWDRLQLPRPFARVGLVMAAPLALPDDKEAGLAALEATLADVTKRAAELVGAQVE